MDGDGGQSLYRGDDMARHLTLAELICMGDDNPCRWRARPNIPGLYLCVGDGIGDTVLHLTSDDLKRGAPFSTKAVYGPIPEVPKELAEAE